MVQTKTYEHNANVEADVHKCLDVLTKGLGYDINKIWYPTTYVAKKGPSNYDLRLKMVFIAKKHLGKGEVYAGEASHALRFIVGRGDAPLSVEEFYDELGTRLVAKLAGENGLKYLFDKKGKSKRKYITKDHEIGYTAADKADLDNVLKNHKDIFTWDKETATKFVDELLAA